MLTYIEPAIERDNRAAYRPFVVEVERIEMVSPSFRRVTFRGPQLEWFATHCRDQRVKLLFPVDGQLSDVGESGDWYAQWRALPVEGRSPFRTYTVRAVRPEARELDVDFFWHGDGGPAAQWLGSACVGDRLVIVGPDARSLESHIGMDWRPGSANEVLIVGDETAAPAVCGILESLPSNVRAHAFIQVPTLADALPGVSVTWVARDAGLSLENVVRDWAASHRSVVSGAVSGNIQPLDDIDVDVELLWDSPEASGGDFYAWIAGESAEVKALRRLLVTELGVDRTRVAFMGYWRLGKAEAQG